MRLHLAYGRGAIGVDVAPTADLETIAPPPRPALDDVPAALRDAVHRPQSGPALAEVIGSRMRPDMRVALVVADWTRACGYPALLPAVLDELNGCGVPDAAITLLVAYGTHTRQSDEASRSLYGDAACGRAHIVHHDCDAVDLAAVGRTSRGTNVRLNPRYLDADAAITLGAVGFHYFAGFGGGPKLVFPGVAGRAGVLANHALYVRQVLRESRRLKGTLAGNACAEDIREAAALAPPAFSIQCLLNERGNPAGIVAGAWDKSQDAVCARLRETAMLEVTRRYDVVIASCGGLPRDINLIQAHKAVDNACELLRDGGTLLIAAECGEGAGSDTFLDWFNLDEDTFVERLESDYQLHGGTALALRRKTARCRIMMKTALPTDAVRRTGLVPVSDLQGALEHVLRETPGARVAYLPDAAESVVRDVPAG
ncbi:MAG: nickel-dependent lactate racemase [Verrucomicrobia bacterium]|nr:nickel-dependent lactate racemase [Verrucomicrobiota bacterium]